MRARQTLAWRAHRPVLRPPRRPPRRLPFAPAAPRFGQRALPSGNRRDVRSRRPPPRATHPGLRPPPRPSPLASEETRRETRPLRRQIIIRATTQRSGGFPTADFGAPVHSQPCPSRCRPIPQIEGRKITGRKIFRRIPARTLSGSLPKNSPTPPRPSSNPPPPAPRLSRKPSERRGWSNPISHRLHSAPILPRASRHRRCVRRLLSFPLWVSCVGDLHPPVSRCRRPRTPARTHGLLGPAQPPPRFSACRAPPFPDSPRTLSVCPRPHPGLFLSHLTSRSALTNARAILPRPTSL